jgi:hypothetical protein
MMRVRGSTVATIVAALVACLLLCSAAAQAHSERPARLPCVFFNPDVGEYGASVFRLMHKPTRCVEYVHNKPCHCTEAPLTGIHWHRWGSRRAKGSGFWHYCGSGTCTWRRARLTAFAIRNRCGPVYTRLRMRLPRRWLHGHRLPVYQALFNLPACGGPFDYI